MRELLKSDDFIKLFSGDMENISKPKNKIKVGQLDMPHLFMEQNTMLNALFKLEMPMEMVEQFQF